MNPNEWLDLNNEAQKTATQSRRLADKSRKVNAPKAIQKDCESLNQQAIDLLERINQLAPSVT